MRGMVAISGFGVRGYYKKFNYNLHPGKGQYMHKDFGWYPTEPVINLLFVGFMFAMRFIVAYYIP